jgi:glucokinase
MAEKLLVFDVGGTRLRGALFEGEEKKIGVNLRHDRFHSLQEWFSQSEFKEEEIDRVVIAAAGPSDGETIVMPNFDWVFNKVQLEKFFDCDVKLLNDLEAAVYLLPFLDMEGIPKGGVKGLIMPGTGLGEGIIVPFNDGWMPLSSEGGHCIFAPQNKRQKDLAEKIGFPLEVETFLSGGGLQLIHHSLTGEKITPEEVVQDGGEAVEIFVEMLLNEATNFALRTSPRGGLFLAGGIVSSLAPTIKEQAHLFYEHPRMGYLLKEFSLAILNDAEIVLQGAALFGMSQR